MNWITLILIVVSGAGCGAAYWFGWREGRQYGRDEQWVEDVLATARRDAERRDAYGRFRSLGGKN